jgi:hypothetical protein
MILLSSSHERMTSWRRGIDVIITDAKGLQHPPDDFHRLLAGADA